jgi:hypothetical protein
MSIFMFDYKTSKLLELCFLNEQSLQNMNINWDILRLFFKYK